MSDSFDVKRWMRETVVFFAEIKPFLPPHHRDQLVHISARLMVLLGVTEDDRSQIIEMTNKRLEEREKSQEHWDNQMVFVKGPPLPDDPKIVWRMGLLRGKKIAVEAWLRGEEYPEEMLLEIDAEIEKMQSDGKE